MTGSRRRAAWAGLALIVVTNGVALGGAALNRLGTPDARLALTERELSLPGRWRLFDAENSGMSLALRWRTLPRAGPGPGGLEVAESGGWNPGWLDAAKMASLGFGAQKAATHDARLLERGVYLVLELDGPAHREALRRAAQVDALVASRRPEAASDATAAPTRPNPGRTAFVAERDFDSRLFVVDAGLDREALRARYPDHATYAIVRGRIRPHGIGDVAAGGDVTGVVADEIDVPLAWRPVFENLRPRGWRASSDDESRFDAIVVVGQRSEPWLAAAAPHPPTSPASPASQATPGR